MKKKMATTRYDVAEHLRTPEEMAAYLEACIEEADGERRSWPKRSATSLERRA
jgi:DNA-binding phage protein